MQGARGEVYFAKLVSFVSSFLPCSCRPRGVPFYLGLIAPFIGAMVLSWSLLLIALLKGKMDILHGFQILVVSGFFSFGWIFALAVGEVIALSAAVLQIVFCLFGGLLGFYIFVLYCVAFSPVRRLLCRKKGESDKASYLNRSIEASGTQSIQRLVKPANNNRVEDLVIHINSQPASPTVISPDPKSSDVDTNQEISKETSF